MQLAPEALRSRDREFNVIGHEALLGRGVHTLQYITVVTKMSYINSLRRGPQRSVPAKAEKEAFAAGYAAAKKGVIPPPPGKAPARRAYKPRPYKPVYSKGYTAKSYYRTPTPVKKTMSRKKTTSTRNYPDSVGATIGGYLGHGIQGVVKALTGFGDYKVAGNSLMSGPLGGNPPIIRNSRNNGIIVRHREYLADVFAATSFTTNTYPINPGLIQSFPWLQQQADSFEQYKFRGLVFEFKSMSSDAVLATSASSALGTVIMSTQYNVLDEVFTDKRTMENYEYANSTKPSLSMLHPIECKMSQTTVSELYVRTGIVSAGDLRLYDLGNFVIAVQGMQNAAANQVIGELWCTYEVEFFKPKLLVGGGALLSDHYYGAGANLFSTVAQYGISGTMVQRSGSNLGTVLQLPGIAPYAANAIVFPRHIVDGTFMITYILKGSVATAASPTYTASGTTVNIDVVSSKVLILQNNAASWDLVPNATFNGTAQLMLQQVVRVIQTLPGTPAGMTITWTAGAYPTGNQTCELIITQLAPSIN